MNKELEVRYVNNLTTVENRTITGYAIVFEQRSKLIGGEFYEIIKLDSVSKDLIERSDIKALFNHNKDLGVLARSKNGKGTLKLELDERGLKYTFDAPSTRLGDEILESIKRGDLQGSSFAFRIAQGGQTLRKEDNNYIREITKIELLDDISIVVDPAYEQTSVSVRDFSEFIEDELNKEKEELLKKEELDNYYKDLESKFLK